MGISNKKFSLNDQVVHCREGLSTIVSSQSMGGREYFVVKTNRDLNGDNIYVPKENPESIIRHIMDISEADEVLKFMKGIKKEFNTNTKQRRDAYKRSLASGNVNEIAYLTIQFHYLSQDIPENEEIKLGPVDIEILSYASNMLFDELAITFDKPRCEIQDFVLNRIQTI